MLTNNPNHIKANRILSLSGGGVKGIAELIVLVEIEKVTGKSISELFPIIAGTSVGGLTAALLTVPKEAGSKTPKYSAQEVLDIFTASASKIFPNIFLGSLKQFFTHKYDSTPLKEILEEYLGNNRLNDTTSRLIIPVTDLSNSDHSIKVFDTKDSYSPHIKVKDILPAATAAPSYFEPVTNNKHIITKDTPEEVLYAYADGGLGANRPAIEVLKILKKEQNEDKKNIICSINFDNDMEASTAIPKNNFEGIIRWLIQGKLVARLMQTNENLATEAVELALGKNDEFTKIFIPITKQTADLDNASSQNIKNLIEIGKKYIEEHEELLKKLCNILVKEIENTKILPKDVINDCSDERFDNNLGKEALLEEIREIAKEFHQQLPDLEVDKFLNGLNDYTYNELEKLVIKFCDLKKLSEKEAAQFVDKLNILDTSNVQDLLNLISDFSNDSNKKFIFSSCSIEAAEVTLEGVDPITEVTLEGVDPIVEETY